MRRKKFVTPEEEELRLAIAEGPLPGDPVLTIRQPWALLVVEGVKTYEFRSWYTSLRGVLWIHAGSRVEKDVVEELFPDATIDQFPTSALVGAVYVSACLHRKEYKTAAPEIKNVKSEYAWKLACAKALDDPIPALGRLGIWKW